MAFALSVEVPCQPFDVAFHPSEPLICSGLISGTARPVSLNRLSLLLARLTGQETNLASQSLSSDLWQLVKSLPCPFTL